MQFISVEALTIQPDGRLLVTGEFDEYNGTARRRIARLNPDGSLDVSFDPGAGLEYVSVEAISCQPDGQILIAGTFTSYDGTGRNRIARINGDLSTGVNVRPSGLGLDLWPNPADQLVHVAFPHGGKASLRVVDLHGASVLVSPLCSSLPLDGLASGVYVVQALDADDRVVASARLVKD